MTVTITINCQNAAFGEDRHECAEEIAQIMAKLVSRFRSDGPDDGPVIDSNGNRVGSVLVS